MTDGTSGRRQGQDPWAKRADYLLAGAALLFLAAYAVPILRPQSPNSVKHTCEVVTYVIWAMFGLDYLVRLSLAPNKGRFFWRHLLDLISIVLPVLRPLRLLRLVALVRVVNRRATASLHGRIAIYVSFSASLIIFVGSLAILDAERGKPAANIDSFGNALWWAATTVTTVGYGDHYPVTFTGRCVAIGLMIAGITLLGVVTASIASWLISRVRDVENDAEHRFNERFDLLHQEINELKTMLAAIGSGDSTPS